MDIVDAIKAEHDRIEEMLEQLDDLAGNGPTLETVELAADLVARLRAHAMAERDVLYQACIRRGGALRELAQRAGLEHDALDAVLMRLRMLHPGGDGEMKAAVGVVRDLVSRHARDEEEALLLPKVAAGFPHAERLAMGEAFAAMEERALEARTEVHVGEPLSRATLATGPGLNDGEILP